MKKAIQNTFRRCACLCLCLVFCLPSLLLCACDKKQPDRVISDRAVELFSKALAHYLTSAFHSEAKATVSVKKTTTDKNGSEQILDLGSYMQTFSFVHERNLDPARFSVVSYVSDPADEGGEKELCFSCEVTGNTCVYTDRNGKKTESEYEKDAISRIGPLSLEGFFPDSVYAVTDGRETRVDLTFSGKVCAGAEGTFLSMVNTFALGQNYTPIVDKLHVTMLLHAETSAFLSFSFSFTARPKADESAATFEYEYEEVFS